jgi:hypothetical protein
MSIAQNPRSAELKAFQIGVESKAMVFAARKRLQGIAHRQQIHLQDISTVVPTAFSRITSIL